MASDLREDGDSCLIKKCYKQRLEWIIDELIECVSEFDILAQVDMLEAGQTPHTWCNPRRKLAVFKKESKIS